MTQAQTDDLIFRLDEQHNDLLRRLDDLDSKIAAVFEEWSTLKPASAEAVGSCRNAESK